MCTRQFLSTSAVTAMLVAGLLVAAPHGFAGLSVNGGGIVSVTDADGNDFPLAGEFAVNGGVNPGGVTHGRITFVFRGDFASYWGALPGVTDTFRLIGTITAAEADGGDVILGGTLTEIDHAAGQGVVFAEHNVPFQIVAQPGSKSFVLQFCLLPPFVIEVADGTLSVDDGTGAAASALGPRRPEAQSNADARPMSCAGS